MSARATQKWLRIGIIQEGKIVQEHLIRTGQSVIVGESARNTFVFPKTHLPSAEFSLFQFEGGKYVLNLTEKMTGRIRSGDALVGLEKLRADASAAKKSGVWQLPMSEQDRGKIKIDSVTVLFQFVNPPPERAVRPIHAMDFRPRMLEEDDPVFLGFIAIWSALAVVFMVWVLNTAPREFTLEQLPERFTKLIVEKPAEMRVVEEEEPIDEVDESKGTEEQKIEEKTEKKASENETKVEKAERIEKRKEELIAESKFLKIIGIGTTGDSKRGVVENLWSDEEAGYDDIDQALKEAGHDVTADSDEVLRRGKGGVRKAVDIGELGNIGGERVDLQAGPSVRVEASVESVEGNVEDGVDKNQVKTTVKAHQAQLKACYEMELKANPKLEGRVEVHFVVAGGAASDVFVTDNNTGNAALADCVVMKIQRWKFSPEVEGDVTWPFVFRAKK